MIETLLINAKNSSERPRMMELWAPSRQSVKGWISVHEKTV